jgi:hypothetical protein
VERAAGHVDGSELLARDVDTALATTGVVSH